MYKVNFVSDEDFERLPGMDMHNKIGVAYPKYGEAYIRKSGSNAIDVFTAIHELDHLQGSDRNEKFDSENECYYKGFADIFQPIASAAAMIPGPWQIPSAIAAAGSQFLKSGPKSTDSQQQQPDMGISAPTAPMGPGVSQASGGIGGGGSMGAVGGNAIKGLSQMPQFNNSMDMFRNPSGNYSGRQ